MREDEAEAALRREIAYIANGDMISLTLIQGVLNAFVLFLRGLLAAWPTRCCSGTTRKEGQASVSS